MPEQGFVKKKKECPETFANRPNLQTNITGFDFELK
jgi:hypothetical protein